MQAPRAPSLSTFLGGAAVFVGLAGLVALLVPTFYARRVAQLKAERGWTSTPAETREAQAAQAARLGSYGWIDRQKGVVALPIERAMELVVTEAAGSAPLGPEESKR